MTDAKAPEAPPEQTEKDNVKEDSGKKVEEDELSQKRKARHISMGDEHSSKSGAAESAHKPSTDSRKVPTAGMALGKEFPMKLPDFP